MWEVPGGPSEDKGVSVSAIGGGAAQADTCGRCSAINSVGLSPHEEGLIWIAFKGLDLETEEGLLALAIGDLHVHAQNVRYRIRLVLVACASSIPAPGQMLRNWDIVQRPRQGEHFAVDPNGELHQGRQSVLGS